MAGIVLVTKPSFIFQNETNTLLNGSWIKSNATKDWRDEYEKGIFFLFNLKSKCKSKMISLHIFIGHYILFWLMIFYFFTFNNIAPIPPEHDPEDYYFIGALVALSCAIFGGALIVICSKVNLIIFCNIYWPNRIKSTPYFLYI